MTALLKLRHDPVRAGQRREGAPEGQCVREKRIKFEVRDYQQEVTMVIDGPRPTGVRFL
ncbi:MAG: hypothetical protein M1358_15825 [Chloroflexi bacterium]|nr:hypothetical protein [Chloroflexota bacterium]